MRWKDVADAHVFSENETGKKMWKEEEREMDRSDVEEVEKRILVLNYAKRFDLVTSPLQSIILMPSDEVILV